MDTFVRDLQYGARTLFRSPSFALVAILALGLGIGANTAIFSLVNSLLLRPLPYHDSERLAVIWTHSPGVNVIQDWPSPGQYLAIKSQTDVFDEINIAVGGSVNLTGQETPERLGVIYTRSTLFPLLGVQPALGRAFLPEEDSPGKPWSAILSYSLWQRRFGSDEGVIGSSITLNGRGFTVVGVMPKGFSLDNEVMPTVSAVERPEIFLSLPFTDAALHEQGDENYNLLARLKPGATFAQAQAELDDVARRLGEDFPDQYPSGRSFRLSIRPLLDQVVGDVRPALLILLGAVGCVLLIACANVANLMLARAANRVNEIAIRTALGAGRWRLIRQMLTESALLSVIGGAFGVLLAIWGLAGMRWLNPGKIPRIEEVRIDGRVLAFTFVIALTTGLLCGIAPAWRSGRLNLSETLKEGARTVMRGQSRLRSLLVISEIALSLVLLTGAGLLIRSFLKLQDVAPGFDAASVMSLRLSVVGTSYAQEPRRSAFFEELLSRISRLPGVQSVGATSILPLSGGLSWGSVTIDGYVRAPGEGNVMADRRIASSDYFETLKIPLIKGRYFSDQDTKSSQPVAVIDQSMATKYWPNGDPIGKRIKQGPAESEDPWLTIVGVVGNVKQYALDADSRITFYSPQKQDPYSTVYLAARTKADPFELAASITREARAIDPNVPVYDAKTMDQRLVESLAGRRFSMAALGLFAGVAMLLAVVGLYGVMSYSVAQRTREIGIRVALGAGSVSILRLVVGNGMALSSAGVAIGIMASLALTRVMTSLLYGVSASDPLTFAFISLVLCGVALLACYVPARRATRVDPVLALRHE